MYIPDSIRLVIVPGKGKGIEVYSADEGHMGGESLPVRSVNVEWDRHDGLSARVAYGGATRLSDPEPTHTSVIYPQHRITFELRQEEGEHLGRR